VSTPFWSRRAELELLERAAGISGRVVVTGPRGMGKSALAAFWGARRVTEGKGRVLLLPPPTLATPAAEVAPHVKAALRRLLPHGETGHEGWQERIAGLLSDRTFGALVVDGLESYRHCLGPAAFGGFLADLEALPGPVVATGVPAIALPLSPSLWTEIPLCPIDDEVVREILERLWRVGGGTLGESSRDLLLHLIGGSPLALSGWARAIEAVPSLERLDRPALLTLHANLLTDGMIGRWWGRWWESLFPDAAARRVACAAALPLLDGGEAPPPPLGGELAAALATAGILTPTPGGHAPVNDPQAARVLQLAAARTSRTGGGEVPFLASQIIQWERKRGLSGPRRLVDAVVELLRAWSGVCIGEAVVGSDGPLVPLPAMTIIAREPKAAPGDLPFLLLEGVAAPGPLGGRWLFAVATGGAPLAAGEVAGLVKGVNYLRQAAGESSSERLFIVSAAGFTGGARTEASHTGAWHADLAALNALRAACGLVSVPPLEGRAARLPRSGIEGQVVELSLPPAADVELVAAAAADCLAGMAGFSKEDRDRVRMAVVEGAINALEHGDGRVHLRLAVTADGISVTLRDFGPGVGALPEDDPAGPPGRRRGWGTTVMRQLMDEVKVEQVAEGAKIVLVKRRPAGRG
jgi:stage II sporulation protein AB (anti-sigma F factor)